MFVNQVRHFIREKLLEFVTSRIGHFSPNVPPLSAESLTV